MDIRKVISRIPRIIMIIFHFYILVVLNVSTMSLSALQIYYYLWNFQIYLVPTEKFLAPEITEILNAMFSFAGKFF